MPRKKQQENHNEKPASLKTLADHLGLSPATISVVLNDVPGRSIPQATRDRIKAAAKKLNYQPSLLARSLRNRRTHTIGILVPELGEVRAGLAAKTDTTPIVTNNEISRMRTEIVLQV